MKSVSIDPTRYRLFSEGERAATALDQSRCLAHAKGAAAMKRGPVLIERASLGAEEVKQLRRAHERLDRDCERYLRGVRDPDLDARILAAWRRTWIAGTDIAELAALAPEFDPAERLIRAAEDEALNVEAARDRILRSLP